MDGALTPPILCLVTDGSLTPAGALQAAVERIRAAAHAGVDLIQIRERRLDDRGLLAFVRAALQAAAGTRSRVVVNDRLDIALVAGAAGVHLRSDSYGAGDARALAGSGFLIGRSVHSVEEAVAVEKSGGCDYLVFGTVYPSAGKPDGHPIAGADALARVCRAVRLPVLAIGGVTVDRGRAIAATGAAGVAAIGLFSHPAGIDGIVQQVRYAWA